MPQYFSCLPLGFRFHNRDSDAFHEKPAFGVSAFVGRFLIFENQINGWFGHGVISVCRLGRLDPARHSRPSAANRIA